MKICVIHTGGTIGSSVENGYVNLDNNCSSMLVDGYFKMSHDDVIFEEKHPLSMLSENVSKEDLEKIIGSVREEVNSGAYDGIIVTHGTDTLCFTANVLSQVFANTPVPIVLVSALLPLEDARTNGYENFKGAVDFIRKVNEPRVFVSFKNGNEDCIIHDAAYLLTADEITGYMHSLCNMYYGIMKYDELSSKGRFLLNESYIAPSLLMGKEQDGNAQERFFSKGILSDETVTIRSRSLLNFKYYHFDEINKPKALLIELYHSGTLCSKGDEYNAVKFIEKCVKENIIVIIGPVKKGDNVYESMRGMVQSKDDSESGVICNNCIISYNQSFELTVAKVSLALGAGAGYEDIKKLLE